VASSKLPRVEIEYCRRCHFQLRAAWLAQEILSTFEDDVSSVALIPSDGGVLELRLDGEVVASNRDGASMPDVKDVKSAIRNRVAPERRLGHEGESED
jgi:selenoprotein W-related protein